MSREGSDKIKETIPGSLFSSILQLHGRSCTNERDKISLFLEKNKRAFTVEEISEQTGVSRMSIYRTLKLLQKKQYVHFARSLRAYFVCQKPMQGNSRTGVTCHSYAVCPKCALVEEFIHSKHSHPRLSHFKNLSTEHEWTGLCKTCLKP